jgi:hypothetical protein
MVELYFYSPYVLMVLCLIKHRDNFTLPLTYCFSTPVSVLKTLKFADSRSDEVNAFFFNLSRPSGRTRRCGLLSL